MLDLDENVSAKAPGDPGISMFIPIIDPRSKDNSNVFPLDGVNLETVSNADLIGLLDTAPILYQVGGTKVVRISHNLILKSGGRVLSREARTLQLIAKRTSLRVPRVYRTFQVKEQGRQFGTRGHIIMDYIDGKNLGDCWKQLTGRQKDDIVCQAVGIVQQLQALTFPTAGPLGGGVCTGQLFSDFGAGPFDSNSDMEAWFNRKLAFCQRINKAPPEIPPFEFSKFVMTHQDISPRNIILDASEKIWLVDWADSGAFPPAFERGALAAQVRFPEFNRMMLDRVLPQYFLEERQLHSIGYALFVVPFDLEELNRQNDAQVQEGE
ncbi:hypothetical protein LOZ53_003466 [Ophidiomyces ophidiicola]|nr:hypothetical protein LOZ55_005991 [Ophidiomyces ophidiicola]KAI1983900.1 hypothetical protein LOZ54_004742 [Ophidiomyces ophidiicola]KAI1989900.1 hypothetical protein LOZ53_003466 [Ophidiomyces ophidiicola]KAI2001103.1 hypothetical protein LOZ51_001395 [Ophidiomyces ophidiicola]